MVEIIILLTVGLFSGVLSGVLGIGGGLVIVPALIYFLKMSQHSAQGTTLALMLPPITLLSTYAYWKAGYVDIKVTIYLCIGFFLGGYFGGKLAVMLPAMVLRRCFAVFLMGIAVHLFLKK
jgi:uncharacterized membrane protein YfcA